jgi:hypothetical protein
MVDDVDRGKLPIRPPERSLVILPAEPSSSKSEGSGRMKLWIFSTKYFFHTRRILLHAVKSYDIVYPVLLLRKSAADFFIALKNPSLLPGLNPRTLGSMASTLTVTSAN